jgi:L-asparaginase/Glu-tRNA(Gln) amidotransferase subunit D
MHKLMLFVVLTIGAPAAAQEVPAAPKVRVVATGGTIAGEQQEPGTLGNYQVKKDVNEIVALIPFSIRIRARAVLDTRLAVLESLREVSV